MKRALALLQCAKVHHKIVLAAAFASAKRAYDQDLYKHACIFSMDTFKKFLDCCHVIVYYDWWETKKLFIMECMPHNSTVMPSVMWEKNFRLRKNLIGSKQALNYKFSYLPCTALELRSAFLIFIISEWTVAVPKFVIYSYYSLMVSSYNCSEFLPSTQACYSCIV